MAHKIRLSRRRAVKVAAAELGASWRPSVSLVTADGTILATAITETGTSAQQTVELARGACECGHNFGDHLGDTGPCTYEDGRGTCSCSSYSEDATEASLAELVELASRPLELD